MKRKNILIILFAVLVLSLSVNAYLFYTIRQIQTQNAEIIGQQASQAQLIQELTAEIEALNASHAAEIETLEKEHTAEIDILNGDYKSQIEELEKMLEESIHVQEVQTIEPAPPATIVEPNSTKGGTSEDPTSGGTGDGGQSRPNDGGGSGTETEERPGYYKDPITGEWKPSRGPSNGRGDGGQAGTGEVIFK